MLASTARSQSNSIGRLDDYPTSPHIRSENTIDSAKFRFDPYLFGSSKKGSDLIGSGFAKLL